MTTKTVFDVIDMGLGYLVNVYDTWKVEKILDDVIFIKDGEIILHETSAAIRNEKGCSVDEYFREVYDVSQNDKVRI